MYTATQEDTRPLHTCTIPHHKFQSDVQQARAAKGLDRDRSAGRGRTCARIRAALLCAGVQSHLFCNLFRPLHVHTRHTCTHRVRGSWAHTCAEARGRFSMWLVPVVTVPRFSRCADSAGTHWHTEAGTDETSQDYTRVPLLHT